MQKKILLIGTSPRKNGNSEVIVDTIAGDIKDAEVTVFKMREKK
jgi:multimeric flavodoxin WrbA